MNIIKLKGVGNVRDLGGIRINDKTIRTKLLIRGQSLYNATPSDIDTLLNDYKVKKIIDLRTDMEASRKPNNEIKGIECYHIPIFNREVPGITNRKNNQSINISKIYSGMLKEEYLENISKIIKEIIHTDGCVYFHCSEGKDRTGIISMIILLILGANKETILEDYLYTNVINKSKANKYYFLTLINTFNKEKASNIKSFYLAKEEYIESALDVISNKYKDVEDFAIRGLNLTQEELYNFRDKCLK